MVLEDVGVAFQLITGLNLALQLDVFISKLQGIIDHTLDVLGGKSVLE